MRPRPESAVLSISSCPHQSHPHSWFLLVDGSRLVLSGLSMACVLVPPLHQGRRGGSLGGAPRRRPLVSFPPQQMPRPMACPVPTCVLQVDLKEQTPKSNGRRHRCVYHSMRRARGACAICACVAAHAGGLRAPAKTAAEGGVPVGLACARHERRLSTAA